MILLKILGLIDLISGTTFLMIIFGLNVYVQVILFCASLLLLKGMFALGGDVLSFVDLFSSVVLFLSIFLSLPTFLVWICAFLLFAKGFVSFL